MSDEAGRSPAAAFAPDDPRLSVLETIACSVPPGAGGAGRHFEELIGLAERSLPSFRYICPAPRTYAAPNHIRVPEFVRGATLLPRVPSSHAYGGFILAAGVSFDIAASRHIKGSWGGYTGFTSQALSSLRKARRSGVSSLGLVALNTHVDNLWRQQQLARSRHAIDRGWLTNTLRKRTRKEYELADVIFISSDYQRSTFLEFGVEASKLVRMDLRPSERFQRRAQPPSGETFNVVYVGRLDLIKGIPVLLDAFAAVRERDWHLSLMGPFCSSGVRRHVERRISGDPHVTLLEPGDPLPLLESAHLFVHPAFEDAFGYGPMEALTMGVPVVVTDQTGMAEHVREGVNGSVVAAGDVTALAERLRFYSKRA
jgi:glycosyltransferase involved in cell wall biosynthesis